MSFYYTQCFPNLAIPTFPQVRLLVRRGDMDDTEIWGETWTLSQCASARDQALSVLGFIVGILLIVLAVIGLLQVRPDRCTHLRLPGLEAGVLHAGVRVRGLLRLLADLVRAWLLRPRGLPGLLVLDLHDRLVQPRLDQEV